MNSDLNDVVLYFKAQEKAFSHLAVLVLDSQAAQRMVAVWSTMPLEWNKPKRKRPTDDGGIWDWVWEGVKVDWVTVANRAGIDPFEIEPIKDSLVAARMLYPNGEINGYARAILAKRVAHATVWPGKKKEKQEKPKDEKETEAGATTTE